MLSATALAVSGLTFIQPANANQSANANSHYFVVESFPKFQSTLSNSMKRFIRNQTTNRPLPLGVTSRAPVVRVVCTGTVRGVKWTAKREKLALDRATVGCDYMKTLYPNVPTELKKRLISKKSQNSLTVRIRVFHPATASAGAVVQAANPSGIAQYAPDTDNNNNPLPNEPLAAWSGAFPNLASITTSNTVKRFLVDLTQPANPNSDPLLRHRPTDYDYDQSLLIPEATFDNSKLSPSATLVKNGVSIPGQIYVGANLQNVYFFMDGAVDHTQFTYGTSAATLEAADYISVTYDGRTLKFFLYEFPQIVQ